MVTMCLVMQQSFISIGAGFRLQSSHDLTPPLPLIIVGSHHLYSAVHYFETLHKINDIHQRVTRDTLLRPGNNPKIVQFDTLGRLVLVWESVYME